MSWIFKNLRHKLLEPPAAPRLARRGGVQAVSPPVPRYRRHTLLAIILHWVFSASVLALLLSGLYLGRQVGFRWLFANMKQARVVHFYGAFVATLAFIIRSAYAFKSGDYRNIALTKEDLRRAPAMLAYTFFLRPTAPPYQKYNPLQKLVYTGWFFLFLVMALVGFINYFQNRTLWAQRFLPLRLIAFVKNYGAFIFLVTIIIHIYLAVFEDYDLLRSIFTGYTRKATQVDPLLAEKRGAGRERGKE